jgi:hypothetical protein
VSESRHEDFIDLAVDTTQDPVTIMTAVSRSIIIPTFNTDEFSGLNGHSIK